MYKLMLSDLDETLLVDHHVPYFNCEAIKKIRDKGVKFVVATGRSYNMIFDIICQLLKKAESLVKIQLLVPLISI